MCAYDKRHTYYYSSDLLFLLLLLLLLFSFFRLKFCSESRPAVLRQASYMLPHFVRPDLEWCAMTFGVYEFYSFLNINILVKIFPRSSAKQF